MSSLQCTTNGMHATLHVFFQEGAWHWGISVPRERGDGFQVIAYNHASFAAESDAATEGGLALDRISRTNPGKSRDATGIPFVSIDDSRRRYMRERLRCVMARLVGCDEAHAVQAARWVTAWGALLGEQHFDKPLRKRPKNTGAGA